MQKWFCGVVGFSVLIAAPAAIGAEPTPEELAYQKTIADIAATIQSQYGDVSIAPANVTFHLGQDYYFIGESDARRIIVEAWNNPPNVAEGVLGLVFKKGEDFNHSLWSAVVTYDPSGYVTDSDAKTADYGELIAKWRAQEPQINAERKEGGYPLQHLIGWAQPPSYDPARHTMIWAQDIQFGDEQDHTLSYDVRILGRNGVLSLNMISGMSSLAEVRQAAQSLAQTVDFNKGARYADFDPNLDKKAGYGLAGLVAAGLGVAATKKLGLLALLAAFGKKLIALAVVAVAVIGRFLRSRFGKRDG